MLDEFGTFHDPSNDGDWKARASSALSRFVTEIAEGLLPGHDSASMQFMPVKVGQRAMSLKVGLESATGFLKLFDGGDDQAAKAYDREKTTLLALGQTGLVPRIKGFCDAGRFVIMEFVEALSTSDPNIGMYKEELAYRIGEWIAHFDQAVPVKAASGDWGGYLAKFGDALDIGQIKNADRVLANVPLCGLALARNDGALHNFMICPDGRIIGCDFEAAQMRPRGWDYMMTYQALLQRFPKGADAVLTAYSEGYAEAHQGALSVDELNDVARILYCAQALSGRAQSEDQTWL